MIASRVSYIYQNYIPFPANEKGRNIYTLDADAKRIGVTLPDGKSWAYSYDSLNQVTGGILSNAGTTVSSHAYTYDMIGNRLTANDNGNVKQYTANNLNQYTAINSTELTYDADGNMLSDGQFTYSYDALNQLVSVENTTDKQVFIYDFMGRRIVTESYSKNGEEWQQVSRRRYVYQNWNVIAEYDNGAKTKSYVWGEDLSGSLQGAGGVGGLLLERSNGDYLPTYDGNGNIIAYKNSEGDVVATYSYDPFGNIIAHTGLDFSYKFSTKPQDELSGIYYYGYRFYHYALGRWINRDPIGETDIPNLYTAIANDVVSYIDILGLATKAEAAMNVRRLRHLAKNKKCKKIEDYAACLEKAMRKHNKEVDDMFRIIDSFADELEKNIKTYNTTSLKKYRGYLDKLSKALKSFNVDKLERLQNNPLTKTLKKIDKVTEKTGKVISAYNAYRDNDNFGRMMHLVANTLGSQVPGVGDVLKMYAESYTEASRAIESISLYGGNAQENISNALSNLNCNNCDEEAGYLNTGHDNDCKKYLQ